VDAHTVEVSSVDGKKRLLKAKHVLIATGGVVTKLKIPGAVRGVPAMLVHERMCHMRARARGTRMLNCMLLCLS